MVLAGYIVEVVLDEKLRKMITANGRSIIIGKALYIILYPYLKW